MSDYISCYSTDKYYSPLISVILPTYNSDEGFLKVAIDSVRNQTYENWELCVVDDCSSSIPTLQFLDSLADDPRIRLKLRKSNGGIQKSSQDALEMALGDYVSILDHDDRLLPNALGVTIDYIRQNVGFDFFYTDHETIDTKGAIIGTGIKPHWSPEFFLSTNYVAHFKTIKRSALLKVDGFVGTQNYTQDTDLIVKLLNNKCRIKHIPHVLYQWRSHPKSVVSGTDAKPAIVMNGIRSVENFLQYYPFVESVTVPPDLLAKKVGVFKINFKPIETQTFGKLSVGEKYIVEVFKDGKLIEISTLDDLASIEEFCQFKSVPTLIVCKDSLDISDNTVREMLGYLLLDDGIGAVTGRTIGKSGRVFNSGFNFSTDHLPISSKCNLNDPGYWFTNRIVTNTDGLNEDMFSIKTSLLKSLCFNKRLKFEEFVASIVTYISSVDLRVVNNPNAIGLANDGFDFASYKVNKYVDMLQCMRSKYWDSSL